MTQESLFGKEELPETEHEQHWKEMPEYSHKDMRPEYQLIVSFKNVEDLLAFGEHIGQKLTRKTQSIWYPEVGIDRYMDKRYVDERELYANAAGKAYGDAVNTEFEKGISEDLFPDNPEKAKDFQVALEESRDELREKQQEEVGEAMTFCPECAGAGSVTYDEFSQTCHDCGGTGMVTQ